MRFQRLDLLKFGKFSERSLEFRGSATDFHLIVGPNEAGKSTLRAAILDLLFGIPVRSPHGFLHPLNELKLGASVSNGKTSLDFVRIKAQRQTLRTPADGVLPDLALEPFLGGIDRDFFDRMFGLDHFRLVQGGNDILNAESDIGRILFQSAAGVASLGTVRDQLAAEADKLWAPRKSAERTYYAAADQLEQANSALKKASVRTKVWAEANSAVETLRESLEAARTRWRELDMRRARLERVRRLAPLIEALGQNDSALELLKEATDLPEDAARALSQAERDIARAEAVLKIRKGEVTAARESLSAISVDEFLLSAEQRIAELEARRVRYEPYARDIERRKSEIQALQGQLRRACLQLKWAYESEEALLLKLPSLLIRRKLGDLARKASGIEQSLKAADSSERTKKADIESLEAQLDGLAEVKVTAGLRAALRRAQSLGDPAQVREKQRVQVEKAETGLETALRALGVWRMDIEGLSKLQFPSGEAIAHRLRERQNLDVQVKSLSEDLSTQISAVGEAELRVSQFTELRHPTTYAMVEQARAERDEKWGTVKQRTDNFEIEVEQFESAMHDADALADTHLSNVEDVTELQSHKDELERQQHAQTRLEHQLEAARGQLDTFSSEWGALTAAAGIGGLPLDDALDWIRKKDVALERGQALLEAQKESQSTLNALADATQELLTVLEENGVAPVSAENLNALCIQAEHLISEADGVKGRRDALNGQLATARQIYLALQDDLVAARKEAASWADDWASTLSNAGLDAAYDTGTVEGALELIGEIEEKARKVCQIQAERIDTMKSDLALFAEDVEALCGAIAVPLDGQEPAEVVQQLVVKVRQANEARSERERLTAALRAAEQHVVELETAKHEAEAVIEPLKARAGVSTREALAECIAQSDEKRRLLEEASRLRRDLMAGGDGQSRQDVEGEIAAANLPEIATEIAALSGDLKTIVERQGVLSAELATAESTLTAIGGSDAAAEAEGQRQEALSKMADAAERYVKVFTAARLLRWSIDRYRQDKQGPMLAKASTIFAELTQGSFERLVVDFDKQPMVLEGRRPDGKHVGISGMSDGTRDQLFLALRLAALEIRLEQASKLPFIADDLFINYDDARSAAGLRSLASLAKQTQVIFLTHHHHMEALARDTLGDAINVVHL
ncbi:ATP-binding protein [Paraburkholderia acidipaludis]|uniref:ATP-binding protein n=1 Tax=Paraburkholderia acidipaludis TaxID=660537 RepID=UPI00047F1B22|nr:YhaN family protein [Paraburkholderia acidipaludis]